MGFYELVLVGLLICLPLWLVSLIDLLLGRFATGSGRLLWALIVIFVPFGWVFYLSIGRREVISGGLALLRRGRPKGN